MLNVLAWPTQLTCLWEAYMVVVLVICIVYVFGRCSFLPQIHEILCLSGHHFVKEIVFNNSVSFHLPRYGILQGEKESIAHRIFSVLLSNVCSVSVYVLLDVVCI
jgi:hypothetical protein